jgi:uncharacterized sulfatase
MKLTRRQFIGTAGAGLAAVALPGFAWGTPGTPARKRNVLFITVDDWGCRAGCYGTPLIQTPNIDGLAARGVRFDRAYCQESLCSPSRTSMLTGLYPDQTGVHDLKVHFRDKIPNVVTLPQLFRQNGYRVERVGKVYHQGVPDDIGTNGLDDPQSWDAVHNPRGRDKEEQSKVFTLVPNLYGGTLSWLASEGSDEEMTDGMTATEIIRLMETNRDRSFFLAAGFYRPHTPFVAPKKYFDLYPLDQVRLAKPIPINGVGGGLRPRGPQRRNELAMTERQRREAIQAYFAATTFMDAQVGRLLVALDRLKLADNTVVVLWGDNGYSLGEHNCWQKRILYEESARVPLIIAGPGTTAAPQGCRSLAEMVDLYPTMTELCGLPKPAHLAGTSLLPQLQDAQRPARAAALTQCDQYAYSIRTDRWRYSEYADQNPGAELFDHEKDPDEWFNVADNPAQATTRTELQATLQNIRRRAAKIPPGLTK